MMTKIPPFITGQCVKTLCSFFIPDLGIKITKGQIFTVTSVRSSCCGWLITIGIKDSNFIRPCDKCDALLISNSGEVEFCVEDFAIANKPVEKRVVSKTLYNHLKWMSIHANIKKIELCKN